MAGPWNGIGWVAFTKAAILLVFVAIAVAIWIRWRVRDRVFRRFAKRHRFAWFGEQSVLPESWGDLECLRMGMNGRLVNCVQGGRGRRTFAVFDFHCDLPGPGAAVPGDAAAMLMTGRSAGPMPRIEHRGGLGFSAAVVACELPAGAKTARLRARFAPWRAEFGARASILRTDDGFESPKALLAAVDRLNAALDEILREAPSAPV
jgi:hypothetical protein